MNGNDKVLNLKGINAIITPDDTFELVDDVDMIFLTQLEVQELVDWLRHEKFIDRDCKCPA